MKKILFLTLGLLLFTGDLSAIYSSGLNENASVLVLETKDPSGDQECVFHENCPYSRGDLRGARLTLKKIPVERGPMTSDRNGPYIYLPVALEIDIDQNLMEGEVQLCVFIHLPPLFIEHIISRDAILEKDPRGGEQTILLQSQTEASFLSGFDPRSDQAIADFQNSPYYRDCFFDAPPDRREIAMKKAEAFGIHGEKGYRFPASDSLYWRDIPSLRVSTSLVVREVENLEVRGAAHLLNDTMEADWSALTEYPLRGEQ